MCPDDQPELATPEPLQGHLFGGRYRVVRTIGVGGFGRVFEAEDARLRKRVAVKVLSPDLLRDPAAYQRFEQEARAASRIGHPNIIDVTDFDQDPLGGAFLVMEFLAGEDLGRVLTRGPLPAQRLVDIAVQICQALEAAHGKGIVHRDLKPSNVYLVCHDSRADVVKLLDFGISKITEAESPTTRLTKTGQLIGTPLYMSPEQASGDSEIDHRTDLYSLGVMLYEAVCGQPPFLAANYFGVLTKHANETPKPPSACRPDLAIPAALEEVILVALEKRPEHRFATALEMETALLGVRAGHPVAELPRRRTPAPAARAVAAMNAPTQADLASAATMASTPTPGAPLPSSTGTAPIPLPARSRTRLVTIVGSAVVLACAAGGAMLLPRKPPPRLVVTSTPEGAEIHIAGRAAGLTPLALDLAPGKVRLEAKLPRRPTIARELELVAGETRTEALVLGPARFSVAIASTPAGAHVEVDGRRIGETPVSTELLHDEAHMVRIEKDGYEPWQSFTAEDGAPERIDVELRPAR